MLRGGPERDPLLGILIRPATALELSEPEWDALLPRARAASLLPRLAFDARAAGLLDRLPPKVGDHLAAATTLAQYHARTLCWEIGRIERALGQLGVPILLLKGAAYLAARLRAAGGRLVADTDIMVPRATLCAVEAALLDAGWQPTKLEPYDQLYYRTWMHELPPLRHRERDTVVDVHHAILPPSARLRPDSGMLWAAARPLGGGRLHVLAPADMVLHAAVHLFHDGDLRHALRGLVDIADLLGDFEREPNFWSGLARRAAALDLGRPLFYALRFCRRLLRTSIPDEALAAASVHAPPPAIVRLMDRLVPRTLIPGPHPGVSGSGSAALLLYMRAHWLRMPPWLLARHLAHQSVRRLSSRS
jgi:hypothetical protein